MELCDNALPLSSPAHLQPPVQPVNFCAFIAHVEEIYLRPDKEKNLNCFFFSSHHLEFNLNMPLDN